MKYNILATLVTIGLTINLHSQSPWTQKKGETFLQINFTTIPAYNELFGNPNYFTEREIIDNSLQFYAEYGLTDKTTLIANIPLKYVASNSLVNQNTIATTTEDNAFSLGNIQLGLKHTFYQKKWLFTGQFLVEANTSSFEDASGLRTGYDAWTFSPLVSIGRSYKNWYLQAFTGLDIRTNQYSSGYRFGTELGYKALKWLWVAGFLDNVISFRNGDVVVPSSNSLTGLYVNDQSYAAFGLKFIGEITQKLGANLSFGGAFDARNVAKSPAITLGFYHKF